MSDRDYPWHIKAFAYCSKEYNSFEERDWQMLAADNGVLLEGKNDKLRWWLPR